MHGNFFKNKVRHPRQTFFKSSNKFTILYSLARERGFLLPLNFSFVMNIFVARLNFKTKREDLEAAFAKFGQVTSAKIVKDRDTGRSKGFGFVEMANDEEGNKAIAALNETDLDGRTIVVKPANPKGAGPDAN
jgi:RNA recognition motif-containing protein